MLAERQGCPGYQHSPLTPAGIVSQVADTVTSTVSRGRNRAEGLLTPTRTEGEDLGKVSFVLWLQPCGRKGWGMGLDSNNLQPVVWLKKLG